MRRNLVILAVTLYVAMAASSAYAHHSHPYFYDQCKSITIEGRVERVEFKDPHTWIVLRLDDGTAYTVDWAPLSRLTNNRHHRPRERSAGVWSARRGHGQSNTERGPDTRAFPGLQERRESEHRRPELDTPCGRQFQLGAAPEREPSELRSSVAPNLRDTFSARGRR